MKLKIGDKAPDFSLLVGDGKRISLKDFESKFLLLYFYPKDDTPGCTIEAKSLSNIYQDLLQKNVEIIGISKDKLKSHTAFKTKYNIPFSLGSDEDLLIANAYGAVGEKSMFGKKYFGINRMTFLINKNQDIVKIWNNIDVSIHAKEVLESVNQIC